MSAAFTFPAVLPRPAGRWWRTALVLAAMLIILTAITVTDDCL